MSLRDWYRRHRWWFSAPPEVGDEPGAFDPATDPFRYEWGAERAYEKRGRLGDEELPAEDVEIE